MFFDKKRSKLQLITPGVVIVLIIFVFSVKTLNSKSRNQSHAPQSIDSKPAAISEILTRSEDFSGEDGTERTIAALTEKLDRLESRLSRTSVDSEQTIDHTEQVGDEFADDIDSLEAAEEEAVIQIQEQVELMNATLDVEDADPEWAEAAVTDLFDAFRADSTGIVELVDAECRSTFCRFELVFDYEEPEESFRHLQGLIPWDGEAFFQVEDIATGEAVVFLAREEFSLPRIQ